MNSLNGRIYPTKLNIKIKEGQELFLKFSNKFMRNIFLMSLDRKYRLRFNLKYFSTEKMINREILENKFFSNIILRMIEGEVYVTYSVINLEKSVLSDNAYFEHAEECNWMKVEKKDKLNIKINGYPDFFNPLDEIILKLDRCNLNV